MIFGINTTRDISKLSQISLAFEISRVVFMPNITTNHAIIPILIYRITLRLLAIGIHEKEKDNEEDNKTKARFRRRTFHEPNLIRIKADPNYLDQLK